MHAAEYTRDKAMYFSKRFHEIFLFSDLGLGMNDQNLMRLTVSRCETDLGNIKQIYRSMYGVTLYYSVSVSSIIYILGNVFKIIGYFIFIFIFCDKQEATSGSYRTALLALIGT
jgi:hypothetical protein